MVSLPKQSDPSWAWEGRAGQAQVVVDRYGLVTQPAQDYYANIGHIWFAHHHDASVANGASIDVLISTVVPTHVGFTVIGGGLTYVWLYEAPVFSGGTAITPVNVNREAVANGDAKALQLTVKHTPTVTNTGTTLVEDVIIPAGTISRPATGQRSGDWILAASQDYIVRLTNQSGGNTWLEVNLDIREEEFYYPGGLAIT